MILFLLVFFILILSKFAKISVHASFFGCLITRHQISKQSVICIIALQTYQKYMNKQLQNKPINRLSSLNPSANIWLAGKMTTPNRKGKERWRSSNIENDVWVTEPMIILEAHML